MNAKDRYQTSNKIISKPRAVIVSPTTSQPRYHRRAGMLLEAGYDVDVYSFQRNLYNNNTYPAPIKVVSLGKVESSKYFRRIPKLIQAVVNIRKHEKDNVKKPALVYTFGLDTALVGSLAMSRSTSLVYEIGDLQIPLPHKSLSAKLFAQVERGVLKRCQLVVASAPAFISEYVSLLCPEAGHRSMIIENKLDRNVAAKFPRPQSPKTVSAPIKIGYIGAFKYENCIVPLIDAVTARPQDFELHFFGDGSFVNDLSVYVAKHRNIFYHGPFSYTNDLERIYQSVDISYVVYDNHDANVRLALPNKLYDGPYFGIPLVVADNTRLAQRVNHSGIGLCVNPQSEGFAKRLLEELTPEKITSMSANALKVDVCQVVENYDDIIPEFIRLGQHMEHPHDKLDVKFHPK